ncbi:MAG: hypothetical protein AB7G48_00125 [Nitrospiraceae bacterium]
MPIPAHATCCRDTRLTTIQDVTTQKGAEGMLRCYNEALKQRVLARRADLDRLHHQLRERIGGTRMAEQAEKVSEERCR